MAKSRIITWLFQPKYIFLIDGLGALVTAFSLGFILTSFEEYFGMPKAVLNYLSGTAACFAVYSLSCHFLSLKQWPSFLGFITVANLIYCVISLSLLIYLREQIMALGWIYFLLELLIIIILVGVEFQMIRKAKID
jgi:hypothetical protein